MTEEPNKRKVRRVKLKLPGCRYVSTAPHARLVRGYYHNPSGVRAYRCKGCHSPHRPKLLLRHHVQALELWSCEGCRDVLIKVKLSL